MTFGRSLRRAAAGPALLACGVAGALALAGCSSSSSTAAASPGASSTPGTESPASAASAQPSWASALGTSVSVAAPQSVSPGHGSPGAVIAGFVAALNSKQYANICAYAEPGAQAGCRSQFSQAPAGQMPYAANFALGYTAINGAKAVVGMTGKFCTPGQSPECFTNADPAAVFSTAKSFSALWANAIKQSSDYSLTPCIEIGGKWYIYSPSS